MTVRWGTPVLVAAMLLAFVAAPVPAATEPTLVVPDTSGHEQLRISPDVQAADETGRVVWVIRAGDSAVDLRLRVHEVTVTGDRPVLGDRLSEVRLDRDRLHLAAGEAARVVVASLPSTTTGLVALVAEATGDDASVEVSAIATDRPLAPVDVTTVTFADVAMTGASARVRLDTDGASVVDVAAQWSGLGRGSIDQTRIERVVVPAGGRWLDLDLDGVTGLRAEVDVAVRVLGEGRVARGAASAWSATGTVSVAVLALLAACAIWLGSRRLRRRSRSQP